VIIIEYKTNKAALDDMKIINIINSIAFLVVPRILSTIGYYPDLSKAMEF
jgi:ABC-type transporter Mla maintaining outer membrane lipid asymmetry permease subunit MlaE